MDILSEVYLKSAAENKRNLGFWENYLQNLKALDFSIFSDKLKVPALIPIGSKILFRGELKHTNEVTVALGADYFVKCSLKQAEVLRKHRIKDAQSKVDTYNEEKEYLENQISFAKKTIYDNQGQEIIEYYSEEEDKAWRQKHRDNVRKYKKNMVKEGNKKINDITDDELWNRLEELELQEELENEISNWNYDTEDVTEIKLRNVEGFAVKEKDSIKIKNEDIENEKRYQVKGDTIKESTKKVTFKEITTSEQTSKFDLLQQVIDKQNELEEKLFELKNRERSQSKTETDLLSRVDELEQLDELEDEMDRLDDIIENEDIEEDIEDIHVKQTLNLQRQVSFADEDDSQTVEINFHHSCVEPNNEPYDPNKGIQKPSDIYKAHSKLFGNGITSILKKSKYEPACVIMNKDEVPKRKVIQFKTQDYENHQTIVVKDVVEKAAPNHHMLQSQARPTSLFKKKRMQNKS